MRCSRKTSHENKTAKFSTTFSSCFFYNLLLTRAEGGKYLSNFLFYHLQEEKRKTNTEGSILKIIPIRLAKFNVAVAAYSIFIRLISRFNTIQQ
jgi:hypothetical protein